VERWEILTKNHYDPLVDIKQEWNGLYVIHPKDKEKRKLIQEISDYFLQRNEDSIDE
jgi:hypothetical protein